MWLTSELRKNARVVLPTWYENRACTIKTFRILTSSWRFKNKIKLFHLIFSIYSSETHRCCMIRYITNIHYVISYSKRPFSFISITKTRSKYENLNCSSLLVSYIFEDLSCRNFSVTQNIYFVQNAAAERSLTHTEHIRTHAHT